MVSCPNCGESYFSADTLHELEQIKLQRSSFAEERAVWVAKFHSEDELGQHHDGKTNKEIGW